MKKRKNELLKGLLNIMTNIRSKFLVLYFQSLCYVKEIGRLVNNLFVCKGKNISMDDNDLPYRQRWSPYVYEKLKKEGYLTTETKEEAEIKLSKHIISKAKVEDGVLMYRSITYPEAFPLIQKQ